MATRQEAIEAIVAELRKPGYGHTVVVSPNHMLSVVLQEDTREAFAKTHLDYNGTVASITVGLRVANFVAGTKPERLAGYSQLGLLVVENPSAVPIPVYRVIEGYAGAGVPLICFS